MSVFVRVLVASVAVAYAFWAMINAKESNFQPYWPTWIRLWISGFIAAGSVQWALSGGNILEDIWLRILISTIGGLLWAIRFGRFVEMLANHSEDNISKEP